MKLYLFYTNTHEQLLQEWFLPSLQDNYKIILNKHDQTCITGNYMEKGWIQTMIHKVDTILQGIYENISTENIFIHSDVDIQFFDKTSDIILKLITNKDIIFQKGSRSICCGFFACKANMKTLQFWQAVKNYMLTENVHDEKSTKALLSIPYNYYDYNNNAYKLFNNEYNIRWDYLPDNYFVGGHQCVQSLEDQSFIYPPKTLIMHHATSTIGLKNKIKQLQLVKEYKQNLIK